MKKLRGSLETLTTKPLGDNLSVVVRLINFGMVISLGLIGKANGG
jgi:hypothetical protein